MSLNFYLSGYVTLLLALLIASFDNRPGIRT